MGRKGAKMLAREPAANITMADLADWWFTIKREHAVELRVTWTLSGSDELARWSFTIEAYNTPGECKGVPYDQKTLSWPTASHKTVLGALLWLLVTIEDDLTASSALDAIRSAGL